MKKIILGFLLLVSLMACWPVWAQTTAALQINVEGIGDPLKGKMMTLMANRSQDIPAPLTTEKIQRFVKLTPNYIRRGLQPYGYFKPQITTNLSESPTGWTLTVNINLGPVIKVVNVDLQITGQGSSDHFFRTLSANLPIKTGQNLNVDDYQKAKDNLFNLASNRGYFSAKMIESKIIINVNSEQASIVLHFDTGPRYRFGQTLFPPSDLNLKFLERFLRYQPGDYYNSADIQKTQQVLAGSGYFSQAVVMPLPEQSQDSHVPVKIELTPVKPRRYTFGLGYGTDTGPRGTLGFNWIPINSYGHHINILARGSYINTGGQTLQNNTINGSYIIPGNDPATDSYAISAGYGNISQASVNGQPNKANSFKTALSYNTVLNDNWQQVLALTYLTERYQLTDTPFINANVLYPSGHWQYIRNQPAQKIINNGISASFDLAGASEAVISKTNFVQGKTGLKALGTLDPTHTRFLFRGQLGRTQVDDLQDLPLTLQLYAGGPASIRGFKYNSIGPGKNLALASGEIQQRVYKDWYLAAFLDSGSVSDSDIPLTNFTGWVAGAGGGVVVLTAIGAVELDVARPVINARGNKTWQLEFSVGAEL